MNRKLLLLLFGGAFAAYYFYSKSQGGSVVTDAVDSVTNSIKTLVTSWKNVGQGYTWIPYIAQAEIQYGLPTDLLSRMAYQESSFDENIIRGIRASPAGALGILQMMPQYFSSVNAPRPYADSDVIAQINQAGEHMASLYSSTKSWPLALAAYNAGLGNVQKYKGIPPFPETQNYVAKISADVPSLVA